MAPVGPEGDEARERFHSFAEMWTKQMQEKYPNEKFPDYSNRDPQKQSLRKANTPGMRIDTKTNKPYEAHVTHEKLDGFFSTTFFQPTA